MIKVTRCPYCHSKAKTFVRSDADNMCYCLSCGRHEQIHNVEGGITVSALSRVYKLNKYATWIFEQTLRRPEGRRGFEYLKKRELSDETIRSFHLGFAPKGIPLEAILKQKGYTKEEMEDCGLFKVNDNGSLWFTMADRVIFPIIDENDNVIGFGGRVMGDGEPKYKNSPETAAFSKRDHLYAFNRAKRSGKNYMFLCEGYMDVIALHQAGFTNAVASLGTALTENQAGLIRTQVEKVVLLYDTDVAGQRATSRAIGILKNAGIETWIANTEPCKDPDEFIKKYGAAAFHKQLTKAITPKEFRIRAAINADGTPDYRTVCSILLEDFDEKKTSELLKKIFG